jgi:phosphoglycolate phosphatase
VILNSRFDCVVFDWDGTLMDSTFVIADSIQKAAADVGLPVPSYQQASYVIGLGLRDALLRAMPTAKPEQYGLISERYRFHYLARDADLTLFPGIVELLAKLKQQNQLLAVATGKSRVGLNRALQHASLRGMFDATRCADEGEPKPHPWMLQDLSRELEIPCERMLMIGDTVHDRELARRAGASFVGVSYGAHPAAELGAKDCLACVDGVHTLSKILLDLTRPQPSAANETQWQPVCTSNSLEEGQRGERFDIASLKETGFVVRFDGQVKAFVNRCAHISIELDWQHGQFFDDQGLYLVCSTHGAMYDPADGRCISGPCAGKNLICVPAREVNGQVQVDLSGLSAHSMLK